MAEEILQIDEIENKPIDVNETERLKRLAFWTHVKNSFLICAGNG